ncbi:MAG: hypothetical protein BWY21_00561 [Parcubacteria group bacterium ADurb.Bin216]|nr:MAG: hypothetical protein BWY21_00561 [Parcubacteria group bacterium ADurb.Bin216]
MYIVLVGPPGKCRKGTAMNQGMYFLREMGIKLAAESITREALIRELKNSNNSQINIATGDMYLHASLTIYSQELTVFLGYNNQALMADLTDWFDCRDSWTYRTKNMGTDEIIGVWVNLIGATTPDLLQTTLPRDAIGSGLTSRIIFVYEHNKGKVVPAPFLSREERELREFLRIDLERISMLTGEFTVSDSFIDAYVPWYSKYSEGAVPFDDHRFSGYFERRPTHLLKLSMICNASRTSDMKITDIDFHKALSILQMTEKNMPYTFSGVGKSSTADVMQRVLTILAVNKKVEFAYLMSQFYQDVDKLTLEKMLETLLSMGCIEVDYSEGRRMIIYKGIRNNAMSENRTKEE